MKEVFPSEKLEVTWKTVVSQAGAFKRIVNTQIDKSQPYIKVVKTCEFENLLGDINIFFDESKKIAGFNIVPSQATLGYRPQEPKKPYPYKEQEVVYKNEKADITITGTLTLPETKGSYPAIILVNGSGQQTRNSNISGHQLFLVLADYLTRKGIAVLRTDDRGVGGTTVKSFDGFTSDDSVEDVLCGIEYLKSLKEIDTKHIGIIGHSEGGLIAPLVAVKSKDISFMVIMAGPGLPGDQVLYLQNAAILKASGVDDKTAKSQLQLSKDLFYILKQNKDNDKIEAELKDVLSDYYQKLTPEDKKGLGAEKVFIQANLKTLLNSWLRFYVKYDPRPALTQVKCPILAINGSKDLQVTPKENLKVIRDALRKNKDATVIELPELNHLFQTAQTGLMDEYFKIEETISPAALKVIGDWIIKRTGHH